MDTVTIDSEQAYDDIVDELADKATDRMIETAGSERYADSVVEGMKECVYEIVGDWWDDAHLDEPSQHEIIKQSENNAYDIAAHVRQMSPSGTDEHGFAEVIPEDVQQRVALVTLRTDVVQRIHDAYGEKLQQAAQR